MKTGFKMIAAAALIGFLLPFAALAQSGQREQPGDYCYISSPAAATGLSGFTCDGGSATTSNLGQFTYGFFCVYTQGIVWKDDGQNPTGTPGSGGNGVSAGSCFWYNGNFQNIKFIQQTSGAIVGATLYH